VLSYANCGDGMSLTIYDFSGWHKADNLCAVEEILSKRYGPSANGFWISNDDDKMPVISLLVKESLATLVYFPSEGHPGFVPVGGMTGLDKIGFTAFRHETIEQEIEIPNSQVVPFASALQAAEDFYESKALPKSIEWTEL
jgi:hypothetical protein